MKLKGEILFDVPEDLIVDLRDNWGCGLESFLHDEIDVAVNYKIRLDTGGGDTYVGERTLGEVPNGPIHPYRIVGIKVGSFASGELYNEAQS